MTTGSKGLHVIIPLKPEADFTKVRRYAEKISDLLIEKHPRSYTKQSRDKDRNRKTYIDYLRNGFGQTHIAPYSLRALEGAPIATPISWRDLNKKLFNAKYYHLKNVNQTIFRRKSDPWKDFSKERISLVNNLGFFEIA